MESPDDTSGLQDQPHLGDSINVATRALHAKLNKQILQYFPLALPPHANDPSVYLAGMLQIAPLYLTFESLWEDMLAAHEKHAITTKEDDCYAFHSPGIATPPSSPFSCSNTTTSQPPQTPLARNHNNSKRAQALLESLRRLYDPLLARTNPLLSDLCTLTRSCPSSASSSSYINNDNLNPTPTPQAKLAFLHSKPESPPSVLGTLLTHMHQSITISGANPRPHLVLAYAWVLYMALFAGGRALSGVLEGVGEEFWEGRTIWESPQTEAQNRTRALRSVAATNRREDTQDRRSRGDRLSGGEEEEDTEQKAKMPLAFFRFDTPQDGEDLKIEFKPKFQKAGELLTARERDEVVKEAVNIFEHLIALVAWLHETLSKDGPGPTAGSGLVSRWVGRLTACVGLTARARFDSRPANNGGSRAKKDRGRKMVRFEEAGSGKGGEQGTQCLLQVWSLVLGLLIIGIAVGLAYAWK